MVLLTESAEGDEPTHHESGVEVELLLGVAPLPGVPLLVVHRPEDGEGRHSDEEDGGERDDERALAPLARASTLIVLGLVRAGALTVTNGKALVNKQKIVYIFHIFARVPT